MCYLLSLLFFVGAMNSMCMAVEEFRLLKASTSFKKETPDTAEEKEKDETRIQTSYNLVEKEGIVLALNSLRRTVGASDMTYMDWDDAMATDAAKYTAKCNYSAVLESDGWGFVEYNSVEMNPATSLAEIFIDPGSFTGMRSVYLLGIGLDIRFCSSAQIDGVRYNNIYLGAYLFSYTSDFNDNYQQYTFGKPCTTCRSGVFWCDLGLCRDACSDLIIKLTCSCFTNCTECEDWDTESCTCPSQPNTDAVTLNCKNNINEEEHTTTKGQSNINKGVLSYKAGDSMAVIVLSTLALFYLQ